MERQLESWTASRPGTRLPVACQRHVGCCCRAMMLATEAGVTIEAVSVAYAPPSPPPAGGGEAGSLNLTAGSSAEGSAIVECAHIRSIAARAAAASGQSTGR